MIDFWVNGQPPRKSNNRKIVKSGGKYRVIKSAKALAWVEAALLQIPVECRGLELGSAKQPLTVSMDVYYTSKRPDLSGELVLDMLQKARVISDDRHVYEWHLYKKFSKDKPGVYIRISDVT